jgi:hypothetical protein
MSRIAIKGKSETRIVPLTEKSLRSTETVGIPTSIREALVWDENRRVSDSIPNRYLVAHNSEVSSESMRRYLPPKAVSGGGDG